MALQRTPRAAHARNALDNPCTETTGSVSANTDGDAVLAFRREPRHLNSRLDQAAKLATGKNAQVLRKLDIPTDNVSGPNTHPGDISIAILARKDRHKNLNFLHAPHTRQP